MADKKISQLTGATTPLAGTEVLPIVQSGSTVKVAVSDVTAGRAITAASITVGSGRTRLASTYVADVPGPTGNDTGILFGGNTIFPCNGSGTITNGVASLGSASFKWYDLFLENNVVVTAGKGIDFSANAHAPGMTSEVLDWYEEGTWTPTLVGGTTAGDYTVATTSAKYTRIGRQVTVTAGMVITVNSAGTGVAKFGGLPFAKGADQFLSGSVYTSSVSYGAGVLSVNVQAWTSGSSSDFALVGVKSGTAPYDVAITDFVNGSAVYVTMTYFV